MTAMLAAVTCVLTMIIKIPSPLKGYLNLGDCAVLLSGWMLSPVYGFAAAAVGSALADVFSGYVLYAPATFLIKGIMALVAHNIGRKNKLLSGISAELVMVLGYYIFEGFIYGFISSAVNLPANFIQGVAGLITGMFLVKFTKKFKLSI